MKVILLKDVKDLGAPDIVADVSDGYARNFLLPRGFAVEAKEPALRALGKRKQANEERKEKERGVLRELASKVNGAEISIEIKAGESGKLFGSVTSQDIAQKAYEALGVEIDRKMVILDEPIKSTGTFELPVKFASDISATLKVNVIPTSIE